VTPTFLTLEEVLMIHGDQIKRYGGAPGIRDTAVLRSALAMPQAGAGGEYFHGDLFEMAAAYLFHLVMNHAFVDGNKRVGTAAAVIFLDLNGVEIAPSDDDLVELVLGVIAGQVSKAEVANFLRHSSDVA
jgi:death-on-curing protein